MQLIEQLRWWAKECDRTSFGCQARTLLIEAADALEKAPTIDAVEVTRCRFCKYHHWEQEPCHGKTEHFCSVLKAQVFADFYCYYGKPKEKPPETEGKG